MKKKEEEGAEEEGAEGEVAEKEGEEENDVCVSNVPSTRHTAHKHTVQ